jgi:hypothetical protein
MSTTFEGFLATAIFLVLLATVVGGVSYILYNKISQVQRIMLKSKAEAIAQAVAFFIEVHPDLLENRNKLEEELTTFLNGYIHEVSLNKGLVPQMQVNITFPVILEKYGDTYKVNPPVNIYLIRFLGNERYTIESVSDGVFTMTGTTGSAEVVVASNAIYVISSSLKECNSLPQSIEKNSYCYIIHLKGVKPCISMLLTVSNDKGNVEYKYNDSCYPSLANSLEIKQNTLPDTINWLTAHEIIKAPFAIWFPNLGCYYIYPISGGSLSLYRKSTPTGVIIEEASTLVNIDGCVVLVKVSIWV